MVSEHIGGDFIPAPAPVTQPVTKVGGQPVWLADPTWPISRSLGTPMRFVAQFALAGPTPRLAYVFMTDDADEYVDDTWLPEGGENACFLQPGGSPDLVEYAAQPTGPTLGPDHVPAGQGASGSEPDWLQQDETPDGFSFVAQLSSTAVPLPVNFGDAGVGYVFCDTTSGRGRFLWQD